MPVHPQASGAGRTLVAVWLVVVVTDHSRHWDSLPPNCRGVHHEWQLQRTQSVGQLSPENSVCMTLLYVVRHYQSTTCVV